MSANTCQFCLTDNRLLFPVKKLKNVLHLLNLWKLLTRKDKICWECKYLLKKFYKFRNRTQQAQHHLLYATQCPSYKLKSLTPLSVIYKNSYDFEFCHLSQSDDECNIVETKREDVMDASDYKNNDVPAANDSIQAISQKEIEVLHQVNDNSSICIDIPDNEGVLEEFENENRTNVGTTNHETKDFDSGLRSTDMKMSVADTDHVTSDCEDKSIDCECIIENGNENEDCSSKPNSSNIMEATVNINDEVYTTNDIHQVRSNSSIILNMCSETAIDKSVRESHKTWNTKEMIKAIELVRSKELGYVEAAKQYNVPRSILMKLCSMKNKAPINAVAEELLQILGSSDEIISINQDKDNAAKQSNVNNNTVPLEHVTNTDEVHNNKSPLNPGGFFDKSCSAEEKQHNQSDNVTFGNITEEYTGIINCNPIQLHFKTDDKADKLKKGMLSNVSPSREQSDVSSAIKKHEQSCTQGTVQDQLINILDDDNTQLKQEIPIHNRQYSRQDLVKNVFPHMPLDLSTVSREDQLIRAYGVWILNAHTNKNLFKIVATKMMKLSELLVNLRLTNSKIFNLLDVLSPKYYDQILESIAKVCKSAPSKMLSLCNSLKKCARLAVREIVNPGDIKTLRNVKAFVKLLHRLKNYYNSKGMHITKNKPNSKDTEIPTRDSRFNDLANTVTKELRIVLVKCDSFTRTHTVRAKKKFWSENDMLILRKHFSANFKCKRVPSKVEILRFMAKYPDIFTDRTWLQIYCKVTTMLRQNSKIISKTSKKYKRNHNILSNEKSTSLKKFFSNNFEDNIPPQQCIKLSNVESRTNNPEPCKSYIKKFDCNINRPNTSITIQKSNLATTNKITLKSSIPSKHKPWTTEASNKLKTYFAKNITNRTTPDLKRIKNFLNNYPELCGGRNLVDLMSKLTDMINEGSVKIAKTIYKNRHTDTTNESCNKIDLELDKISSKKIASELGNSRNSCSNQMNIPISEELHYKRSPRIKKGTEHKFHKKSCSRYSTDLFNNRVSEYSLQSEENSVDNFEDDIPLKQYKCFTENQLQDTHMYLELDKGPPVSNIMANKIKRRSSTNTTNSSDSEREMETGIKKCKLSNKLWTNEIPSEVRCHFAINFENKTNPNTKDIHSFITNNPELCENINAEDLLSRLNCMIHGKLDKNPKRNEEKIGIISKIVYTDKHNPALSVLPTTELASEIEHNFLNNSTSQQCAQTFEERQSQISTRPKRSVVDRIQKNSYRCIAGLYNGWSNEEISTISNYFWKYLTTGSKVPNIREIQSFKSKYSEIFSRRTTNQIRQKYIRILKNKRKGTNLFAKDIDTNVSVEINVADIKVNDGNIILSAIFDDDSKSSQSLLQNYDCESSENSYNSVATEPLDKLTNALSYNIQYSNATNSSDNASKLLVDEESLYHCVNDSKGYTGSGDKNLDNVFVHTVDSPHLESKINIGVISNYDDELQLFTDMLPASNSDVVNVTNFDDNKVMNTDTDLDSTRTENLGISVTNYSINVGNKSEILTTMQVSEDKDEIAKINDRAVVMALDPTYFCDENVTNIDSTITSLKNVNCHLLNQNSNLENISESGNITKDFSSKLHTLFDLNKKEINETDSLYGDIKQYDDEMLHKQIIFSHSASSVSFEISSELPIERNLVIKETSSSESIFDMDKSSLDDTATFTTLQNVCDATVLHDTMSLDINNSMNNMVYNSGKPINSIDKNVLTVTNTTCELRLDDISCISSEYSSNDLSFELLTPNHITPSVPKSITFTEADLIAIDQEPSYSSWSYDLLDDSDFEAVGTDNISDSSERKIKTDRACNVQDNPTIQVKEIADTSTWSNEKMDKFVSFFVNYILEKTMPDKAVVRYFLDQNRDEFLNMTCQDVQLCVYKFYSCTVDLSAFALKDKLNNTDTSTIKEDLSKCNTNKRPRWSMTILQKLTIVAYFKYYLQKLRIPTEDLFLRFLENYRDIFPEYVNMFKIRRWFKEVCDKLKNKPFSLDVLNPSTIDYLNFSRTDDEFTYEQISVLVKYFKDHFDKNILPQNPYIRRFKEIHYDLFSTKRLLYIRKKIIDIKSKKHIPDVSIDYSKFKELNSIIPLDVAPICESAMNLKKAGKWSRTQIDIALRYFKNHFQEKVAPSYEECFNLRKNYIEVFLNKSSDEIQTWLSKKVENDLFSQPDHEYDDNSNDSLRICNSGNSYLTDVQKLTIIAYFKKFIKQHKLPSRRLIDELKYDCDVMENKKSYVILSWLSILNKKLPSNNFGYKIIDYLSPLTLCMINRMSYKVHLKRNKRIYNFHKSLSIIDYFSNNIVKNQMPSLEDVKTFKQSHSDLYDNQDINSLHSSIQAECSRLIKLIEQFSDNTTDYKKLNLIEPFDVDAVPFNFTRDCVIRRHMKNFIKNKMQPPLEDCIGLRNQYPKLFTGIHLSRIRKRVSYLTTKISTRQSHIEPIKNNHDDDHHNQTLTFTDNNKIQNNGIRTIDRRYSENTNLCLNQLNIGLCDNIDTNEVNNKKPSLSSGTLDKSGSRPWNNLQALTIIAYFKNFINTRKIPNLQTVNRFYEKHTHLFPDKKNVVVIRKWIVWFTKRLKNMPGNTSIHLLSVDTLDLLYRACERSKKRMTYKQQIKLWEHFSKDFERGFEPNKIDIALFKAENTDFFHDRELNCLIQWCRNVIVNKVEALEAPLSESEFAKLNEIVPVSATTVLSHPCQQTEMSSQN